MTDETNAEVAAVAPELKSTDTRIHVAPKEPEKEKAPEAAKADPVSTDPEGVEDDAPSADSQQKREQRLPRWMKERMERVRQVTEAETRAKVLEELKSKEPAPEPKAPEPVKADKTLEDFDYDQDAYFDWKVEQKLAQRDQKQREAIEQKKQAEAEEAFKSRIDALEERVGAGAWEDIEASKLNRDPAYSGLAAMIRDEEFGLDIAHHLAKNPEEAAEMVKLPPLKMAMALAKVAEQFTGQQSEKSAPVLPKKTTNAPPPPKTVSGSGKPSVDINAPDLTPEQRIALWRKKA